MEQITCELTPQQQARLLALARATGESVAALVDEALEALQERKQGHGTQASPDAPRPTPADSREPSVLEIFQEARAGIPDEVWQALPADLAAEHDHYIYGTPKRTP